MQKKKPRRAFSDSSYAGDGYTPLTCNKPTYESYVNINITQIKNFVNDYFLKC